MILATKTVNSETVFLYWGTFACLIVTKQADFDVLTHLIDSLSMHEIIPKLCFMEMTGLHLQKKSSLNLIPHQALIIYISTRNDASLD